MDVKEIVEPKGELTLPPPPAFIVAIAVKGNRKSKNVISWTLEKFVPEGITLFKLLHVCPRITAVPTPMGNFIPISQIRDDVAAAYKQEVEWQRSKMLQPYKKMCIQKKVQVDITIIESDDVAKAIAEEVANCSINKLVIGAASYMMFSRKIKKDDLSSRISLCTPSFCTIYAVSKGKLSSIRPPHLATNKSIKDDCSDLSFSNNSSSSYSSSSPKDLHSVSSYSHFHSPSLPIQRFQALSTVNNTLLRSTTNSTERSEPNHSRCQSLDTERGQDSMSSYLSSSGVRQPVSRSSSYLSLVTDNQSSSEHVSISDVLTDCSSSVSQVAFPFSLDLVFCWTSMEIQFFS
ncbi:U-box domain-containing protein 35-like [Pistacia vera]|uniref:U-box domain-containing protein 35-like n=1 Tax=Pistacia vera TaxID=55513 RepID=UPI001262CE7F|nr:U-box domain-containing protein 35-like [Pistacia vera]